MRLKVYICPTAIRMCTWDIVGFFRPIIPRERKASISKARQITGRSLSAVRRDARDEESLREPARLLGCVWEDKRYTGGKGGQETYERKRRHAPKAVRGSSHLRSYQSREGNIF